MCTHQIILDYYKKSGKTAQRITVQFLKRVQNDVQDGEMRDAKWSIVPLKFKWRSCNRPINERYASDYCPVLPPLGGQPKMTRVSCYSSGRWSIPTYSSFPPVRGLLRPRNALASFPPQSSTAIIFHQSRPPPMAIGVKPGSSGNWPGSAVLSYVSVIIIGRPSDIWRVCSMLKRRRIEIDVYHRTADTHAT